jgi:hypothetical protein
MSGAASLPIERLCTHHDVSGFDCGEDYFNVILTEYHRHVYDAYEDVTVLALVDGAKVVGFIAHKDLYIGPTPSESLRTFFIPAFAVAKKHRRSAVPAERLVGAAFEALDRRVDAGHRYDAIACMPHTSPSIHRLLERLGFSPLATDGFFWSKRLQPPE